MRSAQLCRKISTLLYRGKLQNGGMFFQLNFQSRTVEKDYEERFKSANTKYLNIFEYFRVINLETINTPPEYV